MKIKNDLDKDQRVGSFYPAEGDICSQQQQKHQYKQKHNINIKDKCCKKMLLNILEKLDIIHFFFRLTDLFLTNKKR